MLPSEPHIYQIKSALNWITAALLTCMGAKMDLGVSLPEINKKINFSPNA